MSTVMNVSYMTRIYNDFINNYEAKNSSGSPTAFKDKVAEKCEEGTKVSEVQTANIVSTKDMTMEEYKQYIYEKLSQLPMNPSHMQDSISINISEAGFEAMKNDPEYEKWVINEFRTDFATYNPWSATCGGCYVVHYIGASKEECHSESWYAGFKNGNGKSLFDSKAKDSFWERRAEQKKRVEAQIEKQQEKKRMQKEAYEKAEMQKNDVHKRLMSQWAKQAGYSNVDFAQSAEAVLAANAAYETNFLMADSGSN